jgi:hypothetical protein
MFNRITILAGSPSFLATSLNAQETTVETNVAAGPISKRIAPVCFISGANKKYLSYCVTASGTILNLTTPLDHPQLFNSEGYGICNESPVASYWDYQVEGQSANWNEPILLSHTATSMKIARTIADGIWTLTQTILQDKNTPAVKVVMALKTTRRRLGSSTSSPASPISTRRQPQQFQCNHAGCLRLECQCPLRRKQWVWITAAQRWQAAVRISPRLCPAHFSSPESLRFCGRLRSQPTRQRERVGRISLC